MSIFWNPVQPQALGPHGGGGGSASQLFPVSPIFLLLIWTLRGNDPNQEVEKGDTTCIFLSPQLHRPDGVDRPQLTDQRVPEGDTPPAPRGPRRTASGLPARPPDVLQARFFEVQNISGGGKVCLSPTPWLLEANNSRWSGYVSRQEFLKKQGKIAAT